VKIDTEGFDDRVLEGMSFRPLALSFEFIMEIRNVAKACLEMLGEQYIYNYIVGHRLEFASPSWLTVREMKETLDKLPYGEGFGDIFAKRR